MKLHALGLLSLLGGLGTLTLSSAGALDELVLPLDTLEGLDARGVELDLASLPGGPGLRVREVEQGGGDALVILPDSDFMDGTIELELQGRPRADAQPGMRGFVGVAFHLVEDEEGPRYDCLYLRPTNARAEEQLRRNHTTQYVSHPEYPWHRLRSEHPGEYESYVDLDPQAWTRLRIEVKESRAELYVGSAEHPALIVRDLRGEPYGRVALWIGQGTEAGFRAVRIRRD